MSEKTTSEKIRILSVDDDADTRLVIKTILEASGFETYFAESGMKALELLKDLKPHIILLDIMMPQMSGYDVMVRLKQKPETQNIPVIMITAKGEADDLLSGYKDYGVDYYITKPFTSKQLIGGINLILGKKSEAIAVKETVKEVDTAKIQKKNPDAKH